LTFRNILLDITGRYEGTGDKDTGVKDTEKINHTAHDEGIDPFNEITITGVCSKVYRTKFLKETLEVKLRKDADTTDCLPAMKLDGQLSVYVNHIWTTETDLQTDGYLIDESRFISSPLAQVPSCGYTSRDQYSMDSIR